MLARSTITTLRRAASLFREGSDALNDVPGSHKPPVSVDHDCGTYCLARGFPILSPAGKQNGHDVRTHGSDCVLEHAAESYMTAALIRTC